MHRLKTLSLTTLVSAFVGVLLIALTPQAALADKPHLYGSNAWTNNAGILLGGPGTNYPQVGAVDGKVRVLVDRCTGRWCQIRAGRQAGWFPLHQLDFGQTPGWDGPRFHSPFRAPGLVCFFSGTNFTGKSFCVASGTYVSDLALLNRDNQVRSIQLNGNSSALVCRDFNLTNYCVRIVRDKKYLPEGLGGAVSSFRVY
ncbi:peptidase inhibitor family I36 protein [Paradevosia shaoguanensis]|uniref:peptidase inhibitor family I36 protein n=1 Tax=Paradevosia shaoguanensis TaxID=1335043 RepID=UPI003C727605